MDAAAISAELTEYGLALDVNASGQRALLLRVANSGMFKVTQRSGDVLAHLTDWIAAPELSRGTAWNHLAAVRRGETLTVYANGQRLRAVTVFQPQPGWAGAEAGSFDAVPAEAAFDGYRVFGVGAP